MPKTPKDDLRERFVAGKVVLVAGTGVSLAATDHDPLAGWPGLLRNGIDRCHGSARGADNAWAAEQLERIERGSSTDPDGPALKTQELIKAAREIEAKLRSMGMGAFRRWLQDTAGSLEIRKPEILERIQALRGPILTTNHDDLLKKATRREVITWQDEDKIVEVIRGTRSAIVHVHGHWDRPEGVVLGAGYDAVLGSRAAQTLQRVFPIVSDLLFIGCGDGLADPNLGAAACQHLRLCRETERETLLLEHQGSNIHPLAYGAEHAELPPYLAELAPAIAARLPPSPPRFGRDDLLERAVAALTTTGGAPLLLLGGPGLDDRRRARRRGLAARGARPRRARARPRRARRRQRRDPMGAGAAVDG